MTPETPDNARSTPSGHPVREGGDSESIAHLEQALAAETRVSAALRTGLEELRAKVERLEAGFNERLEAATRRSKTAETKLADQQQRLAALGTGREETMRRLADTRAELARVRTERDDLLKKLDRTEGMQTATVALTDEDQVGEPTMHPLPSMDDLMAALDDIAAEGDRSPLRGGHSLAQVSLDEGPAREMIAPELVFSEEDEEKPERASADAAGLPISRLLVFLDSAQPIKYPLYKPVMTIGRSDKADIHVEGDFISRVHARLLSTTDGVVVEDIASKNGIKVNSKQTDRQILHHGDVLGIGKVHFTFIDTNRAAE
ncbi:MAG TPA: FHA domain-containing protein [Gammaproteobacteria bacterium]|nr:FHA domain-containing protein [Gammaproteobacteria bacterium]